MKRTVTRLIILICLVALIWIVWSLIQYLFMQNLFKTEVSEQVLESTSGDAMLFRVETRPPHDTKFIILDASSRNEVIRLSLKAAIQPKVVTLIDLPELKCYEADFVLIYQINNKFYFIDGLSRISGYNPDNHPDLMVVAKALTAKRQWNWLNAFGEFLVKANDEETILLLERYAQGQFSNEELEINKNSDITQAYMQNLSKQLLSQRQN